MLIAAAGRVLARVPPPNPGPAFAAELRRDGVVLRDRLALPLFVAASHRFRGDDRQRLDTLARLSDTRAKRVSHT
jgi:error-prone DNA polymerase